MFVKIPVNKALAYSIFNTDKAVIMANTKAIWKPFLKWLSTNQNVANPVDTFIELQFHSEKRILYSHKKYSGSFYPFQQLCDLSFEKNTHLVLHPKYGPWISLRAIVLGETGGPLRKVQLPASLESQLQTISEREGKYNWKTHVEMRKLIGKHTNAESHEFCDEQLQYHYVRKMPKI
eukprot:NODE_725_length_4426_cov_0.934597.p4 type:complete len:177 gc:universal NODE_725_length_4426_cov_0.934597:2693-2163(-)